MFALVALLKPFLIYSLKTPARLFPGVEEVCRNRVAPINSTAQRLPKAPAHRALVSSGCVQLPPALA